MKVAFNVASLAFAAALAADRLPRAPGHAQSGQPPRLGGRGGRRVTSRGHVDAHAAGIVTMLSGQTAKQRTGIILLAIQAMLTAASICLAFAFFDAAWFDPWTTLPLAGRGRL